MRDRGNSAVMHLPHQELRDRLDADGMPLANGRAEPTNARVWLGVLAELTTEGWLVRWRGSPPPATEAALADEGVGVGVVALTPGVELRLYPSWGLDAVWFDIDGRTLTEEGTGRLSALMRLLGRCTGQPVKLSYEGRDEAFFGGWFPAEGTFRWLD